MRPPARQPLRSATRPPPSTEPPKWFDQQAELAKWLVTLSSGLLGFGFLAVKDRPVADNLPLLLWTGAALVLAAGAALLFIFNSNTYARLRQSGRSETSIVWPQVFRAISFPVMLLAFFVGNVLFLAFGAAHLKALTAAKADPAPPLTVYALEAGADRRPALVAQRGDKLWILRGCDLAKGTWEPLPSPPGGSLPKSR